MKLLIVILVFLFGATFTHAQSIDTAFYSLAKKQNALMKAAYESKDPDAYKLHFTVLYEAYKKLSKENRSYYKSEIVGDRYDMACTYAIAGRKKEALDCLEQSKYYDYQHLREDPDMDLLRDDPRFDKYVELAENKTNKLLILQKAAAYNRKSNANLPMFKYMKVDNKHLKELTEKYKLDSIAGNGSTQLRIIRLMRWVHNMVAHDGSKGNPKGMNASNLLTVCRHDKKTVNCRGMATILNEVYLAMGYKSRIVTCLPKDPDDNDCHVITTVFSEQHRKWLWMDPTFMAYVMDERGNLLSIEEVRDRLRKKQIVVLNADANHNNYNVQSVDYYLEYYMAKNLYKLQCPAVSEYNHETPKKDRIRKYITLVPGDDMRESYSSTRKDGMNSLKYYFTSDPKMFWSAPAGQQPSDFKKAMSRFQRNYNERNATAVQNSFAENWRKEAKQFWSTGNANRIYEKYGRMQSYQFLGFGKEDGVALFRVVCDKSTHAMGITLNDAGHFGTFRFQTSSPEITKMMQSVN